MQKMTPEEIDRAMEREKRLDDLYRYQTLTSAQIDRATEIGKYLYVLYQFQTLTPVQIDKAIDIGEYLYHLYNYQKFTLLQIDREIEKGDYLRDLCECQTLTSTQIDRVMGKLENWEVLYAYQTLTPEQIDRVIEKKRELRFLYREQTLTPANIDRAIEIGEDLYSLYEYQKLTPANIDRAIEREYDLDYLYQYQKLTMANINRAIDKGKFLIALYRNQKLTPSHINRAMDKGEELSYLYQYKNLTSAQIDRAMEIGKGLYHIYEYQNLTSAQIDRAIDNRAYLYILFSYQAPSQKQIQYAIDNNIELDFLYTSSLTSKEQKKTILGKLGVSITEEQMESPLWAGISPTKLVEAMRLFDESIEEKIEERPIDDLAGVYPIEETPFDVIRLCLNKKKFYTKEGDIGYGYYTDKSGNERKIKIGKIIKDDPVLLKSYNRIKQLGLAEGRLEIVISNDSEDIARKSTGQNWTTCETIGLDFGWPPQCGWCDDIKANNLIAYIREPGQEKWFGRTIIRWCIRDDDKSSDAVIENYHGNARYAEILRNELIKILRTKGYSGIRGDVLCHTPYSFTGYLDSGSRSNHHIDYRVGDKPQPNTYQKVYYPKLVEK